MKKVIFDKDITGHHLEYIHHLYMGMVERQTVQYVMIIPESFKEESEVSVAPNKQRIF